MKKFKSFYILLLILVGIAFRYFFAYLNEQNQPLGFHRATLMQKDFFENAFKNLPKRAVETENIKGIVVNHHLLAANFIADAFNVVASNEPKTVVLISPNHFLRGHGKIISSLYDWSTPYGTLKPDKDLIKKMAEEKLIAVDEAPFPQEHGISNLMAFIKKTIPRARIVPIVIKDSLKPAESEAFARELYKILPDSVLVVASLDFSHEVTSDVADAQDAKSIEVIKNFDLGSIDSVHVDSKPSLYVLLKYLSEVGAADFHLLDASNSSKILQQQRNDTTSYIVGFFSRRR